MSGKSLLILILCVKMNNFDIHSLITTVDNLIFSYTGENLDDVQSEIVEGVINHQKYTEIAKSHHRSEKYVKDVAGKLWKTLSEILGEEVNKANLRSSLRRYYYIAFLIHKRYIPDPEQLNQQRFKCAAQMREPL
jgi:hypothetical protein